MRRSLVLHRQLTLRNGRVVPDGRAYLIDEYRKFAGELRSHEAQSADARAFVEGSLRGVEVRIAELEALETCDDVEMKYGLSVENLVEQAGIDAIIARLTLKHNMGGGGGGGDDDDTSFQIDSIASLASDMQALHDDQQKKEN